MSFPYSYGGIRKHVINICGDEKIADKILDEISTDGSTSYALECIKRKYVEVCADTFNVEHEVKIEKLSDKVLVITDCVDPIKHVCIINDDGSFEFFKNESKFKNLKQYIDECVDMDGEDAMKK